jgi:hypothetical protein
MLFNIRFLVLLLILFVKPLIGLSLQSMIYDSELINLHKVYIDTGFAWSRDHEQLGGEEKKYFIKSIFHWIDYFLPNELGNLYANLEKSTLYAKLLLDRKNDLLIYDVITLDELKRHNLICQESFKNIFKILATENTDVNIDLNYVCSLYNALNFDLIAPPQSMPFTLEPIIPNFLKKNKVNPIGVSVDYPMTNFIVTKIMKNSYLPPRKLKNLEKNADLLKDLLKIVEDLSGFLLEDDDKYLFENFQVKLNQKNIRTIEGKEFTAQNLSSTFYTSFITPLQNEGYITKINRRLVPNVSLLEDQKKMIECIIKWRNVFFRLYREK